MLDIALRKKRLEVEQMKYNQAKSDRQFADLKADREAMTLRSPADGLVYYGQCVYGYWATAGQVAEALKPGRQLTPDTVIMTIVEPGALSVLAYVEEAHLRDLRPGRAVRVVPTGYPKHKLRGEVRAVRIEPGGPAPYAITVGLKDKAGPVLPGMTCSMTVRAYENRRALTVPAALVFAEPEDEDKRYVYVEENGEAVKRPVTVGRQSGEKVEILEGLKEGDVVYFEEPTEAEQETSAE